MRKTGNYGWWASGALTVALLAVPALVIWSQNAQAGLKCVPGGQYWEGGGAGNGWCNFRAIAIARVDGYYRANQARRLPATPTRGCNWFRVLKAYGSSVTDAACVDSSPMSAEEARARRKNWAGWGIVAQDLAREECRPGGGTHWIKGCAAETKTCPGGGTILASQQCPKPRKMLTCWDGSQIVARPEQWDNDASQLDAECPRHTVKPAISISVDGGVDEGQAHTWTLHASQAPTRDVRVTVDYRAHGDKIYSGTRWLVAMFGDVGRRDLFNGRGYIDRTGPPVLLRAGQTSVSFTGLGSMQDRRHTADSKVTATVAAGSGYTVGSPKQASAPVWDDDAPQPLTINLPKLTVREGGWASIVAGVPATRPTLSGSGSVGSANLGVEGCVHGRITLTPASGGQPDSSDYRTFYIGDERWICPSPRPQPYAQSGFIQALRDHHDDNGERLIIGWEQTDGDGTVTVNEGSVTITNDGPLPAEWLARVGHGVAGQVVESVATRVFANRSPGEVEGSLGAMPAKDRPITDGDALLTGSSASMTSYDGALAMWARADGTSFSSMTGGDGDVTTGHAGVDYVDGPLMFGLALARSEAEGTYRGGGSNDLYHLESDLTAVYPYTALKLGPGTVWAAAGYGEGESSLSREGDDVLKGVSTDIDWRMAAAGFRVGLREAEDYSLDLVGDALWQGIDSGNTAHHQASSSESTRVRGGVEGGLALGPLTLSPRALLRWDGGDVDDDRSVELGGGLAWAVTDAFEVRLDGSEAMDSGSGWTSWSAGMSLATGAGTVSTNYARDGSYTLGWGATFDGGSVGLEAEPGADRVSGTMSLRF